MATLGISTNTRLLGLAIISKDELMDYKIHYHKSSWSLSKVDKIIASVEPCVRRYSIKRIVLSSPHEYHQTKECRQLVSRFKKHFTTQGITVTTTKIAALYTICSPHQKKTKKALMQAMSARYPELRYYCHKELRNKNKYYIKLFEAVAVATVEEMM